jgi:teichuronic acid biosynthesis glycosyltransferase TuaC
MDSLVNAGHEVEVVAPRPWVPPVGGARLEEFRTLPLRERVDGMTVHFPRYLFPLPKVALYWAAGLLHRRIITRYILDNLERGDVLHAQHEFPDGYGMLRLAKIWKVPLVLSSHGEIAQRHASRRLESPLVRQAIENADAICAVSHHQARLVEKYVSDPARVGCVPIGVNPELFKPRPSATSNRGFRFLFVGQLIHRKGIDRLIRAFSAVAKADPDIHLQVVGRGPLRSALIRFVHAQGLTAQVSISTGASDFELARVYSTCHCLVLPSRAEGRPTVIYEAMSSGIPVIATDVGGVGEQIEHGKTGILLPATASGLESAMLSLARNPDAAVAMGRNGRRRIFDEGWTWAEHANRLSKVYTRVVNGQAPFEATV